MEGRVPPSFLKVGVVSVLQQKIDNLCVAFSGRHMQRAATVHSGLGARDSVFKKQRDELRIAAVDTIIERRPIGVFPYGEVGTLVK